MSGVVARLAPCACYVCAIAMLAVHPSLSHIVPDAATSTSSNKRFCGAYWTAAVLRVQGSHAASCEARTMLAAEAWCSEAVPHAALQVICCCHTRLQASGSEVL